MRFYEPNLGLCVVIVRYLQFVTTAFYYEFCTQLRLTTVFKK